MKRRPINQFRQQAAAVAKLRANCVAIIIGPDEPHTVGDSSHGCLVVAVSANSRDAQLYWNGKHYVGGFTFLHRATFMRTPLLLSRGDVLTAEGGKLVCHCNPEPGL